MRRLWVLLAGGLFLGAGLLGMPLSEAAPKGKVVIAFSSEIGTLDPTITVTREAVIANWYLYDNLVGRDKTMRAVPHLAESVRNINPLTWEIKIRRGIRFHNGEPLTAEAVKFTAERILDPQVKSPIRWIFSWLERVEVVDDHTFRFITKAPNPLVPEALTSFFPVPPQYFQKVGAAGFAKSPVGTGPYKFVEWRRGERLVLEANDAYWMGAPPIQTIIFRPVPETATQIAELLAGNVDVIRNVPPDQVPVIERSANARVTSTMVLRVVQLMMDANARAGKTPVVDLRVRQAINHALDVDGIIQHVLDGRATRIAAGLNPMHFGYDPAVKPYAYDPERAKALLHEAGYPSGFEIPLNYYSLSSSNAHQVVEAIAGYLGRVGIRVKRRYVADAAQWQSALRGGKLEGLMLVSGGSNSMFDADAHYYLHLRSGQQNAYGSDPEIDQWLDAARATLDQGQRRELYGKVQRALADKAFWVPMYALHAIEGVSKKLAYEASGDEIMRVFAASWKE